MNKVKQEKKKLKGNRGYERTTKYKEIKKTAKGGKKKVGGRWK